MRKCDEADELDEEIECLIQRYGISPDAARDVRLKVLRNNRSHDENRSMLALVGNYLEGGEGARQNYFSALSRKERRHAQVGYPTLSEKLGV
jgi:hypothetical protein